MTHAGAKTMGRFAVEFEVANRGGTESVSVPSFWRGASTIHEPVNGLFRVRC